MSRVADEQTASDLLQETFLRVHTKLESLHDEQLIAPWVFQIARNLIIDHHRSKPPTARPPEPDGGSDSLDETNINGQAREWILTALEQLPETYRQAVHLHEFEGLSHAQVADRLKLTLSGAKSRVQRGRQKLKALLHECCAFELDRRGNILDYERKMDGACCGT